MDIMEQIEVIKLYNRNIKRSQSFLYNVLGYIYYIWSMLYNIYVYNDLNTFKRSNIVFGNWKLITISKYLSFKYRSKKTNRLVNIVKCVTV